MEHVIEFKKNFEAGKDPDAFIKQCDRIETKLEEAMGELLDASYTSFPIEGEIFTELIFTFQGPKWQKVPSEASNLIYEIVTQNLPSNIQAFHIICFDWEEEKASDYDFTTLNKEVEVEEKPKS